MTYVKVKGQSRSNVVKNILLLPTLARRITKQVKDDDDLYEGQRSTEVISGQGTCHRDDTVMSSFFCFIYGQFNAMTVTYVHVIHRIKIRPLNNSKTFCESVRAV